MQTELAARNGIEIGIVSDRLNRRKIDLIPEPEWADPPKSRIGELLAAVEERLRPLPGGIGAAIDLAQRLAAENGLPDARITSDVKHIEIGLTDKSDSIAFLMQRIAPARAIRPTEMLIAGDEFGPIAGFEGSDYRMVTRLAAGATLVSVGTRAERCADRRDQLGGGPAEFVQILRPPGGPAGARRRSHRRPGAPGGRRGDGRRRLGRRARRLRRRGRAVAGDPVRDWRTATWASAARADEPHPAATPGAYVAGLFDGQEAGVEDMAVIPDWATAGIEVAGRPFAPWQWTVVSQRQVLDLAALAFRRELVVDDPDGRRIRLRVAATAQPGRSPHCGNPAHPDDRTRPVGRASS